MVLLGRVLEDLGLEGEVSPSGRWVRLQGERGAVYVAAAAFGTGYYSWCDVPQERTALPYLDPVEALRAGLHRARRQAPAEDVSVAEDVSADGLLTEPAERVALALEPVASR